MATMANSKSLVSVLVVFLLVASAVSSFSLAGDNPLTSLVPLRRVCTGTVSECLAMDELEMDSEINRRILATSSGYISYDALRRNSVPCSQRGSSYYNCRPGAQANPYSRGCSRITQCRS